jgi:pilus assembly protein CpaE
MTNLRILAIGHPETFRERVAQALETQTEKIEVASSTAAAVLQFGKATPDIIVVGPDAKEDDALTLAQRTANSMPSTVVILVRDDVQNGLLPEAMRAGVRDVIDLSKGSDRDLAEALRRAISWTTALRRGTPPAPPTAQPTGGKLISVFSSKGGTGKTFLAANLAAAIARTGRDTALVDVDVAMGDALTYYGTESNTSLDDLLSLGTRKDPALAKGMGLKLEENLWGFASVSDLSKTDIPGAPVTKMLESIKASFAYTVADVPGAYSDASLAALDAADMVLLIASLDVVGIRHMSKAIETLTSIGLSNDRIRLVLNRADSKVGIEPSDVEKVLSVKVDAMIPSSRSVPTSLNRGRPVVLDEPRSEVAASIETLIRNVIRIRPNHEAEAPGSSKRRLLRKR